MTATAPERSVNAAVSTPTAGRRTTAGRFGRLLVTPGLIVVALLALYAYVSAQQLDSIEQRSLNRSFLWQRTVEHLELTAAASLLVVLIAVPLGVLVTRPRARRAAPLVLGIANIGQATPAIGLLVLLSIKLGIGFRVALISLVAYAVLPVLRNTITGITQVNASLVESARGMGMTTAQVLRRVELPLAVPVVLAGLRTALVFTVGVATLATFINAGGLGAVIVNGIKLDRTPVLVTGGVLCAVIAFFVDWLGALVEDVLRPRGL